MSVFSPDEMQENAHDEEDEEDECEGITEIRFVPSDKAACKCEGRGMSSCAGLNLSQCIFIKQVTDNNIFYI